MHVGLCSVFLYGFPALFEDDCYFFFCQLHGSGLSCAFVSPLLPCLSLGDGCLHISTQINTFYNTGLIHIMQQLAMTDLIGEDFLEGFLQMCLS